MMADKVAVATLMAMRNINNNALCERANVSRKVMWKLRNGDPISKRSIEKVAAALEVPVDALVKKS